MSRAGLHAAYPATADAIRRCRQELVELNRTEDFESVVTAQDFSSTSLCRDLIFHVQEHRMSLTGIDAFLRANALCFLGFEMEYQDTVMRAYRKRFPGDPAATRLDYWQMFENDNPALFSSTYIFWVQKTA